MRASQSNCRHGFTLVELSIVLLVIALVAGGILIGRDLVRAAVLHGAVAQSQHLQTAMAVFYARHAGIPGDFTMAADRWPGAVSGNGDGQVDELEANNVWHHLSQDGLIEGVFVPVDTLPPPVDAAGVKGRIDLSYLNVITDAAFAFPTNISLYLTITAIPQPTFTFVYLSTLITNYSTGTPTGILPVDAWHFDTKLDDGLPLTGRILSATPFIAPDDQLACPDKSGANLYNIESIYRTCGLWMRVYAAP